MTFRHGRWRGRCGAGKSSRLSIGFFAKRGGAVAGLSIASWARGLKTLALRMDGTAQMRLSCELVGKATEVKASELSGTPFHPQYAIS